MSYVARFNALHANFEFHFTYARAIRLKWFLFSAIAI